MKKFLLPSITIALVFLFTLLVASFLRLSLPVSVTTTMKSSELSVVGEGKVDVVPDTAYVDVGITVSNVPTVQEAQKNIDTTNNKIIAAMKSLGIPKENIKTSNYSIYPEYRYEGTENKISGYNGNVTISIKVKNVELASKVSEEATKSGANQVQGSRFVVENPEKYREEARKKAIANAKDQAAKLGKDLNIKIGRVSNIVESNGSGEPFPMYDAKMSSVQAFGGGNPAGPALEPGSQTITSVVTLYFEKN